MSSQPRSVRDESDGSPFGEATRFSTLWTAWERIRANRGAAGGDGTTVARFETDAPTRVSRLSHALRTGRYRPGPTRRVHVPKRAGGMRPLDIPCVVDRVAQGGVALVLSRLLEPEMEDASFAYRPGRSVAQAVARVAQHRRDGYRYVVDGDIVRYFENVPHERLIALLDRHIDDLRLVDLVAYWLECHRHDERGLPQGSPISPVLANLYLDHIDEDIEGRGVRLVRFADDFVLLCKTEAAARGALERMAALLGEHGLELHPDKTRIVPFDQGFRFLGHVFVRSMVWREVLREDLPDEDAVAAAERAVAALEEAEKATASAGLAAKDDETVEAGRWAPRQRVLYVLEPGRELATEGDGFTIREDGVGLLRLPHRRVDRIEIGPGAMIAHEALELASATETEIVRVDGRGHALGRWLGEPDPRSARHLAQAAAILDPQRRLAIAGAIVKGRIANQRTYVRRLCRSHDDAELKKAAVRLGRILRKTDTAESVDDAMGHEGEAGAVYWPALACVVSAEWRFGGKRARRTGDDAINIMLDVLSSMLARDIGTAIRRAGLHPGFGVLHTVSDRRHALVFDLIEEFRAPVVEACVFALIARKAVRPDMFAPKKGGGRRMTRETWPVLIRGYERWLARPIREPVSGDYMLWRGLFENQAIAFATACEKGAPYRPYPMDH